MARLESPHWDRALGMCRKHELPELPCTACITTRDPDIEVVLDKLERSGLIDEIDIPVGFKNHPIF